MSNTSSRLPEARESTARASEKQSVQIRARWL